MTTTRVSPEQAQQIAAYQADAADRWREHLRQLEGKQYPKGPKRCDYIAGPMGSKGGASWRMY